MEQEKLRSAQRLGAMVALALFVLTALEFLLFKVIDSGNLPWMVIMNVMDAALILYYFMHIAHLWRGGAE
ncbi:MAG: hypothetical protein IID01_02425 [Chloroflexi bacterium]|nr:hypothetical protein [Chloroflexota bacterium]MCH9017879.1 hypothetical protein [Chloroflexota bacterium]